MAVICSCRGLQDGGEKGVKLFLKDHLGQPVRLQDVMKACQANNNPCCSHVKECVGMLNERVEAHNKTNVAANEEQVTTPSPPQYGHN